MRTLPKRLVEILFTASVVVFYHGVFVGPLSASPEIPARVIVDTDFESDVDDVAAIALLHAFADQGAVEIIGMGISGTNEESAPALHAVNAYYGRPDIPIGVRRKEGHFRSSAYTQMIIDAFPVSTPFDKENAPSAISLYRELLVQSDDNSVVIVSLGYLSNLSDLLDTQADDVSSLPGRELIESKVDHYVCMGGSYPRQARLGKWGNFLPDPDAVINVNSNWPTRVVFTSGSPLSDSVPAGKLFVTEFPESSLMRKAYEVFFDKVSWASPPDHHCADLIAIFVGVWGANPFFQEIKDGYYHVFEEGTCVWRTDKNDPDRSVVGLLKPGVNGRSVGEFFEHLILEASLSE